MSSADAQERLARYGANHLQTDEGNHPLPILFQQFRSPMVLILLGAAILSFGLGETDEAVIVMIIVIASTGLGFYQEYRAGNAVAELRRRIAVTSRVWRDGHEMELPTGEVVPGDVVMLRAGSLVPADGIVLEARALHVDESTLTGESFPAVKSEAIGDASLGPDNRVGMGTSVRSGEGRILVTETGAHTEFGHLAISVAGAERETSFAAGTRRFGLLMTQVMFVLVTVVLVANVLLGRPILDSLLFAAALAVGITPELLPAIVTVTLSRGAKQLADRGVLVRRLVAIENLGAMDVLCTDKTGTLTVGDVQLERAVNTAGMDSADVLRWALLNASFQTALPNPLDVAICARRGEQDLATFKRQGELPYDFERKRLSIIVGASSGSTLICKGAADAILDVCSTVASDGGVHPLTPQTRMEEEARIAAWGNDGRRVLAVAIRAIEERPYTVADEAGLTLVGYLLFSDPLKPGIAKTIADLAHNGIGLRIISGDSAAVAGHAAALVGLKPTIVTGHELARLGDHAFARKVRGANVFAEITPGQKEHIVAVLRRMGHTVGYLGDGINDAPALRIADIGISVDNAVDAAKAAADVILLQRDLGVLLEGVRAGRTAFSNTIKYIAITISANFGNMISMAAASLLLPFLPMLATQVLLNNLLSDLPMLAISTDRVDEELLSAPRAWNFRALMRSMLGFGAVSSAFDGLTFFVLIAVFKADAATFQTAWFLESLLTELAIVAVMRTARPFLLSRPSPLLVLISGVVGVVSIGLPYIPIVRAHLEFVPLPPLLLASVITVVIAYAAASEIAKRWIGVLADPGANGVAKKRAAAAGPRWVPR